MSHPKPTGRSSKGTQGAGSLAGRPARLTMAPTVKLARESASRTEATTGEDAGLPALPTLTATAS